MLLVNIIIMYTCGQVLVEMQQRKQLINRRIGKRVNNISTNNLK